MQLYCRRITNKIHVTKTRHLNVNFIVLTDERWIRYQNGENGIKGLIGNIEKNGLKKLRNTMRKIRKNVENIIENMQENIENKLMKGIENGIRNIQKNVTKYEGNIIGNIERNLISGVENGLENNKKNYGWK